MAIFISPRLHQLPETLDKHFAGQTGLVIAAIDLGVLGDAVRWEPSRGGALFPHVYGCCRYCDDRRHVERIGPLARFDFPTRGIVDFIRRALTAR